MVGFDLDLTLIDSRHGMKATLDALALDTGVHIDSELAVLRFLPFLDKELAHWFPAEEVPYAYERFKELYLDHGIDPTMSLPGAVETLTGLMDDGWEIMILTFRDSRAALRHLDHLAIPYTIVMGSAWQQGKDTVLKQSKPAAYIGDHVEDVRAACRAGVPAIGVTTGVYGEEALSEAGAHTVLSALSELPSVLTGIASVE